MYVVADRCDVAGPGSAASSADVGVRVCASLQGAALWGPIRGYR